MARRGLTPMKMRKCGVYPCGSGLWRRAELIKNANLRKSLAVQLGKRRFYLGCLFCGLRARGKAIGGNFPSVRIAGIRPLAIRTRVGGLVGSGPAVALRAMEVVEVSAMSVGAARRCSIWSGATRRSTGIFDWI